MPVVPFPQREGQARAPQVDPIFLAAAMADLHQAGMLVEPNHPRNQAADPGTDQFSTDSETLDEMDSHIPPESAPRPLHKLYDAPPKDVG